MRSKRLAGILSPHPSFRYLSVQKSQDENQEPLNQLVFLYGGQARITGIPLKPGTGVCRRKRMGITWSGIEFEGPYSMSEWEPPRAAALYAVMMRLDSEGKPAAMTFCG
jgi:hypothetical protein